jgi:signal recognition particle subunit SEC65
MKITPTSSSEANPGNIGELPNMEIFDMRTILMLICFCLVPGLSHAMTVYPPLESECKTVYPDLEFTSLTIPDTRYPELDTRTTPRVNVYVQGAKQFEQLKKFAVCVPQIEFAIDLNVPAWVTEFPAYAWRGDDGEEYYTTGTLVDFTRKFQDRNPSFAERVQFDYVEAHDLGYPIRGGHWSVGSNWNPSKPEAIYHLLYHPNHSGKFSATWLEGESLESLLSLHDDDHEGRVKTQFVNKTSEPRVIVKNKRPEAVEVEAVQVEPDRTAYAAPVQTAPVLNLYQPSRQTRRVYRSRGGCPGGRCPTY